ncbi:hypothetical protein D1007_22480 [Hordeum vulgare]|nr:hypothetical protein D1007_22480 [Hordeum vulgare]
MDVHAVSLSILAALVWSGGTHPRDIVEEMSSAIVEHFRLHDNCFKVKPHLPEDFMVTFDFSYHHDLVAASPSRFDEGGIDIHVVKCQLYAHVKAVKAFHHVRLSIKNVALNAWNDKVME